MADVGGFANVLLILGTLIATLFSQVEYWQIILRNCAALVSADLSTKKVSLSNSNGKDLSNVDSNNVISVVQMETKKDGFLKDKSELESQNLRGTNNILILNKNSLGLKKDLDSPSVMSSSNNLKKAGSNKETDRLDEKSKIEKLKKYEDIKAIASKVNFVKPSYKNQFCVLLCCCKKSENDTLVESLNGYHKHVLDVKTVIKLHNDMRLLKTLLMSNSQKQFFDVLSNMKNSKELSIYEDIDGEYQDYIKREVDFEEKLVDGISKLGSSLNEEITEKMLDKFYKKITEHQEVLKRRRTVLKAQTMATD